VREYSTVQYSTVQYSTVQYSSVQYSTVQYSTVQYSTVQYLFISRFCVLLPTLPGLCLIFLHLLPTQGELVYMILEHKQEFKPSFRELWTLLQMIPTLKKMHVRFTTVPFLQKTQVT